MSTVSIRTPVEIEGMREAGLLAAQVLEMIEPHVQPNITTEELDRICYKYITEEQKCIPACLNYTPSPAQPPFPKSICTSVNHVICHGIPSPKKKLKSGDIINIDVTVIKDGFHGDTSKMYLVGKTNKLATRLVKVAQDCMYLGIDQVRPGARLGDIGYAIQTYAEKAGFSVVREFCGHGIGRNFHEEPQVLHYGEPNTGLQLAEGMTFTIEPMVNAGTRHVKILPDQWTVVTRDHKLTAQWEHTLLVTSSGVDILTLRSEEKQENQERVAGH